MIECLKTTVGKSKVLVIGKDQRTFGERMRFYGEETEEVDKFKRLGGMISANKGVESES